ncbi:MAG: alternate-type signal peptide domain-containing protein, partial [Leifsonia sp.]
MNKILKGAIAGAAGIALLLGGAGTFALWNSSTTVAAGTISSGQLSIAKVSDGSWFNTTTGTETAIANVANYKIVPGNSLRWKGQLTVLATGNDL